MNALERRSVVTLSSLMGVRMFGLFLILPVFVLYAPRLEGATPLTVGIALGAYGLTQAVLQVPFGMLSDRYGRKRMLSIGLLLFLFGSVVAALSSSIEGIILGRAIQGAGAISAVVLATLSDLTREQTRTKAMAVVGVSIGFSFLLALMLGPLLGQWQGLSGLFWITACLAGVALLVVWLTVPTATRVLASVEILPARSQINTVLFNRQLQGLNLGIFVLHMTLTAVFIAVPVGLRDTLGLGSASHWQFYVPVLVCSVLGMVPLLIYGMRRHRTFVVFRLAIALLLAAQLILIIGTHQTAFLITGVWLFFVGVNLLEAMLPSLMSRLAPAAGKGTALGIYNTFQFSGVFVGGIGGGLVYGVWGVAGVYGFAACAVFVWLVLALSTSAPALLESLTLRLVNTIEQEQKDVLQRLSQAPGVCEVVTLPGRDLVYLKVDPAVVDEDALREIDGIVAVD